MHTIDPKKLSVVALQNLMQGVVAPRPIALVSSIDENGSINLSPFSFFNMVSTNPPILIFSPARRVRDNTTKHTYENVLAVPEVVINIVSYAMVQQTSLASTEYARGVNEFEKAGFTPVSSQVVKPPRVDEAPAAFECRVNRVTPLGKEGGAGHVVFCEVLLAHFKEEILVNDLKEVDPYKLDAVARMGNDWYCRAQGEAIFKVPKPVARLGIGIDQIPLSIQLSKVLTGNDLGMLGNVDQLPDEQAIREFSTHSQVQSAIEAGEEAVHQLAQQYLRENQVEAAWKILLSKKNKPR